jgi:hypothetical protein
VAATERLKNGRHFHSVDAHNDDRLAGAFCREHAIGSLLTVPIQRSAEIEGLLELRGSKADAFHECDVRTCQLMAGLVAELIQKEVESERALDSSEESKPAHASGGDEPIRHQAFPDIFSKDPDKSGDSAPQDRDAPETFHTPLANLDTPELASSCRVCGRPFGADEAFCGNCSMPRVAASPADGLQSKWASMWFMQQAHDVGPEAPTAHRESAGGAEQESGNEFSTAPSGGKFQADPTSRRVDIWPDFSRRQPETSVADASSAAAKTGLHWATRASDADRRGLSASATDPDGGRWSLRDWRHALLAFVHASRRNKAAAVVVIFVVLLISAWALRPSPSASSSQLTWFESLLVDMGLAEAPTRAPSYAGNPEVQVWVDVHTALYYCPGTSLYGKSPGGYFATQRNAQQDQFHSAMLKPCE